MQKQSISVNDRFDSFLLNELTHTFVSKSDFLYEKELWIN